MPNTSSEKEQLFAALVELRKSMTDLVAEQQRLIEYYREHNIDVSPSSQRGKPHDHLDHSMKSPTMLGKLLSRLRLS